MNWKFIFKMLVFFCFILLCILAFILFLKFCLYFLGAIGKLFFKQFCRILNKICWFKNVILKKLTFFYPHSPKKKPSTCITLRKHSTTRNVLTSHGKLEEKMSPMFYRHADTTQYQAQISEIIFFFQCRCRYVDNNVYKNLKRNEETCH